MITLSRESSPALYRSPMKSTEQHHRPSKHLRSRNAELHNDDNKGCEGSARILLEGPYSSSTACFGEHSTCRPHICNPTANSTYPPAVECVAFDRTECDFISMQLLTQVVQIKLDSPVPSCQTTRFSLEITDELKLHLCMVSLLSNMEDVCYVLYMAEKIILEHG